MKNLMILGCVIGLSLHCGGDDGDKKSGQLDAATLQDGAMQADATQADASITVDPNATLDSLDQARLKIACEGFQQATKPSEQNTIACFGVAIEANENDNSVDCSTFAATCISDAPIDEFPIFDLECGDIELGDDLPQNCAATVAQVDACFADLGMQITTASTGIDCDNFISKTSVITDDLLSIPSCMMAETNCPGLF